MQIIRLHLNLFTDHASDDLQSRKNLIMKRILFLKCRHFEVGGKDDNAIWQGSSETLVWTDFDFRLSWSIKSLLKSIWLCLEFLSANCASRALRCLLSTRISVEFLGHFFRGRFYWIWASFFSSLFLWFLFTLAHSFDMDHFISFVYTFFRCRNRQNGQIEETQPDSVNAYRHKCAWVSVDTYKKFTDVWSNSKQ